MSDRVNIFDTTLRDGEQSPGISLGTREKLEIAEQLGRLGVDVIEAGFPATSPGDFEAVQTIAKKAKGPVVAALARTDRGDIDRAWEAVSEAERPRIHTFVSTSDTHLEFQLKKSREEVLQMAGDAVAYAKNYCEDVEFSPMDATRSDPQYLFEVLKEAIRRGATVVNIPDTVGYAVPSEFGDLIQSIIEKVPGIDEVVVSVHCHNDLGLAVANSVEALRRGARQVECAVNGLGERAGNASLEEIVMTLATREDALGLETGVDTREISRTSRLVSMLTGYPVQPNKAVVGRNAFAHESGIHQDGVLKERTTYEIMRPESVGLIESDIVLGKHSGRHAFREHLEKLGFFLSPDDLDRVFSRFKELADKKVEITGKDLEAIAADGLRDETDFYRLTGYEVHSGGEEAPPSATVTLEKQGNRVTERSIGDGMVDAACKAIRQATGVDARLVSFTVEAITGGLDAVGDVTIQLEVEGKRVVGRGISTDIVEASARAYMNAINRALRD